MEAKSAEKAYVTKRLIRKFLPGFAKLTPVILKSTRKIRIKNIL